MPRNMILVGNGLGMALDSKFFNLENAISEVWSNNVYLSKRNKSLIKLCLGEQGVADYPQGEDDFDVLHRVVVACDFLNSIGNEKLNWLSRNGRSFPLAIQQFIAAVAWHFHRYEGELPDAFLNPLAQIPRRFTIEYNHNERTNLECQ